ncbi:MAG: hypothetical protein QOK28_760 [Actinomycetota bacterium]
MAVPVRGSPLSVGMPAATAGVDVSIVGVVKTTVGAAGALFAVAFGATTIVGPAIVVVDDAGIVVVGANGTVTGVTIVVVGPIVVVGREVVVVGREVVVVGPTVVVGLDVVVVGREVVVVGPTVVVGLDVVVGAVVVLVDVVVVGVVTHPGVDTRFESNVTAPLRASRRPRTVALVLAVIDSDARTLPTMVEPTPSVAELPTFQNTLHACEPLMNETELFGAVMSVDPAWKMNTALPSPWPSRVRVPVTLNDEGDR